MSEDKLIKLDQDPKPITTERMGEAPRGLAMMDIANQTDAGLALLEERVRVAKRQTALVFKLITPSQVISMEGSGGGESVYFTAGAADRILRMGFGMKWGEWDIKIHRGDDETTCEATADLLQQNGEVYERKTGYRAMGGFIRNERDLIKGAICNAKHAAVTDILGLRFLSKADYKELGLDLDKVERRAQFEDRTDAAELEPDALVVPFGHDKGKKPSEISDKQLAYHIAAARKSVEDPAKARWKGKNQAWLSAVELERDRRQGKNATRPMPDQRAAARADTPPPPTDDDMPQWADGDM